MALPSFRPLGEGISNLMKDLCCTLNAEERDCPFCFEVIKACKFHFYEGADHFIKGRCIRRKKECHCASIRKCTCK